MGLNVTTKDLKDLLQDILRPLQERIEEVATAAGANRPSCRVLIRIEIE